MVLINVFTVCIKGTEEVGGWMLFKSFNQHNRVVSAAVRTFSSRVCRTLTTKHDVFSFFKPQPSVFFGLNLNFNHKIVSIMLAMYESVCRKLQSQH